MREAHCRVLFHSIDAQDVCRVVVEPTSCPVYVKEADTARYFPAHTPRALLGGAMQDPSSSRYVPALRFDWLTRYYDVVVGATTRERKSLLPSSGVGGQTPHRAGMSSGAQAWGAVARR